MVQATVLIPTHNHEGTLWYAAQSALRQTVEAVEVLIVGDGATERTREVALTLEKEDSRVQFFDHPKGPRHGEAYRHTVLSHARGSIVCYLSDDDLWLPSHVEAMLGLLQDATFAHALPLCINPDGSLGGWTVDLSLAAYRTLHLHGQNRIPLSCGAHTLSFYQQLPFGWRAAPSNVWTDLYMWQQILSHSSCLPVSGTVPTVLSFPSPQRTSWSVREREDELAYWFQIVQKEQERDRLLSDVRAWVVRDRARQMSELQEHVERTNQQIREVQAQLTELRRQLASLQGTPWWRLRGVLLGLPVVAHVLETLGRRILLPLFRK